MGLTIVNCHGDDGCPVGVGKRGETEAPHRIGADVGDAGVGMSAGLLDVALTVSVWSSFDAPELMPVSRTIWEPPSSLMMMSEMGSRVGG